MARKKQRPGRQLSEVQCSPREAGQRVLPKKRKGKKKKEHDQLSGQSNVKTYRHEKKGCKKFFKGGKKKFWTNKGDRGTQAD